MTPELAAALTGLVLLVTKLVSDRYEHRARTSGRRRTRSDDRLRSRGGIDDDRSTDHSGSPE